MDTMNCTIVKSTRRVHPLTIVCTRCSGEGFIPRYSYKAKGRCFACGGSGRRRDRDQVIEETRLTIFAPVGLSVVTKVVPTPVTNPLAGLPWREQASIRALQHA